MGGMKWKLGKSCHRKLGVDVKREDVVKQLIWECIGLENLEQSVSQIFHDFRFRRLFYFRSERGGKGAEACKGEAIVVAGSASIVVVSKHFETWKC